MDRAPKTAAEWYENMQLFDEPDDDRPQLIQVDGKYVGILIEQPIAKKPLYVTLSQHEVQRFGLDINKIREKFANSNA